MRRNAPIQGAEAAVFLVGEIADGKYLNILQIGTTNKNTNWLKFRAYSYFICVGGSDNRCISAHIQSSSFTPKHNPKKNTKNECGQTREIIDSIRNISGGAVAYYDAQKNLPRSGNLIPFPGKRRNIAPSLYQDTPNTLEWVSFFRIFARVTVFLEGQKCKSGGLVSAIVMGLHVLPNSNILYKFDVELSRPIRIGNPSTSNV